MSAILTGVSDFFNAIFSVDTSNPGMATQLITWLTTPANSLALVGLYLYILVAICGVARRFIPGV